MTKLIQIKNEEIFRMLYSNLEHIIQVGTKHYRVKYLGNAKFGHTFMGDGFYYYVKSENILDIVQEKLTARTICKEAVLLEENPNET